MRERLLPLLVLVIASILLLGTAGVVAAGSFHHGEGGEPAGQQLTTPSGDNENDQPSGEKENDQDSSSATENDQPSGEKENDQDSSSDSETTTSGSSSFWGTNSDKG